MSDSIDPIFSRLQDVKSVLKVKVSDVSEFTGMSKQAIYDIFAGKVESINKKFIEYLTNELNINVNWIFTGEGDMQRNNSLSSNNHNIISNSKTKNKGDIIQSQGTYNSKEKANEKDFSNEVEMLRQENQFLKTQLKFTQELLDKAMSK